MFVQDDRLIIISPWDQVYPGQNRWMIGCLRDIRSKKTLKWPVNDPCSCHGRNTSDWKSWKQQG